MSRYKLTDGVIQLAADALAETRGESLAAQAEAVLDEVVPGLIADELRRIAVIAHEAAQNFDTEHLKVRKDDYMTFARILKERASELDGE